ncbi:MAG: DEAD/DEAH box helicase [Labilithrix sp.]|nr:DEAD/DEAH box helicase [Labilithrix sp.]MCW5815067.1 DEAD/DEAH box helicase [Labilithrix sp.]
MRSVDLLTPKPFDAAARCTIALSPHGVVHLAPANGASGELDGAIDGVVAARIERAFAGGPADGLFHLGAVEVDTALSPPFAFFRELARDFVTALAAEPDLDEGERAATIELTPKRERLEELARRAPPMRGAEYVSAELLESLWLDTQTAFRRDVARWGGSVAAYLQSKNPLWNLVGRVYFHLAENKNSTETPFAFLATYTTRVSADAKPQHRPLGRAVEESAGARDKKALLALLLPVQRASEKSALVRAMVEAGEIYHPLAWTAAEAHAFLREVPALEESGVVVRVPNWWSARRPPRVEVRVTLGTKKPPVLGADALLDFSANAALGDERLTAAELRAILKGTSGLRLVKGRWVEIDRERLQAVLDHWKQAEKSARDGLSFLEGMRLLAGAGAGAGAGADPDRSDDGRAEWSRIEAGPWLASVLDGLRSPEALAAAEPGALLHAELRPYQRTGLKWLFWLQSLGLGGCLADDMGLGKTIQVLALLLLLAKEAKEKKRPPSLLVVPASLVGNWVAEAARFAPSLALRVWHPSVMTALELADGAAVPVDRGGVELTTYGTLQRSPWMREREWDLVVLDEAQAIKNPGAKQTRAVKALRSRARLALTGTPVENSLGDLWSLFDFLSPGLLGDAKDFGRLTKELAKREQSYAPLRDLVRPYILRRLKSDKRVISDLPDKTELQTFCHLTKMQAALYAEAVDALGKKLERVDGIERRGAILAALTSFKQICNHPSHWLGDGAFDPAASGKLVRLRELCEPLAARQDKVLVFTQFREMTAPLARFLAQVFGREGLVLHGGTPVKDRKKLVDAFQSELGPPFFVLSLKAGGTGLNLTAASHVVHFDRWWNPAVEDQATDRAYRIGQKKNVLVHKLVCRGTVEERIDALVASKRTLSTEVLAGGNEVLLTEMSNEALMRIVSLDLAKATAEA